MKIKVELPSDMQKMRAAITSALWGLVLIAEQERETEAGTVATLVLGKMESAGIKVTKEA
jgi:hypothetical protein